MATSLLDSGLEDRDALFEKLLLNAAVGIDLLIVILSE